MQPDRPDLARRRRELALHADCTRCFGLCCVGLSLKASADFAIDKPAGRPCPNLLADFGCGVHAELRERGFSGCVTYDCFGAGQKIAQVMFHGRDWRSAPETAERMFQTLPVMRELHQLMWFITEAMDRSARGAEYEELQRALAETALLSSTAAEELSWGDVDFHARTVLPMLDRVSESVRARARLLTPLSGVDPRSVDRRGVDLRGADLRGADLRGADLRDRDLVGADLRGADLMDADLRRADLAGADLTFALFLTQGQLNSANGNTSTVLPPGLLAPGHWAGRAD